MHLPGREIGWKPLFRTLLHEVEKDHVTDWAAALSYAGILALFPFLLFAVSLASLVIDPTQASSLIDQLNRVAPEAVAQILSERIKALTSGGSPALLTLSAVAAVWAASSGVSSLVSALNTAYDVEETRPFWKVRGLSVLVTLGAAVISILASALAIATPAIAKLIGGPLGTVLLWIRIPAAVLLMMLMIAVLYYVLPDVEQDFKFITPGSVVAVILWIAASLGFSFYVNNFGSYEVVYGALGSVIVLLLWMWISSLAILLGAEINAAIEHLSPEGKRRGAKRLADAGPDAP